MSNRKRKDSWDTTSSESRSRSHSKDSKSSLSSGNKSKSSYLSFSSDTEDELKKSKFGSNESLQKGRKSLASLLTNSNDSFNSSLSNPSVCDSSDSFKIPNEQLPLNVLRLLFSIRESEIYAKNLLLKYEVNDKKLKRQNEDAKLIKRENEKISEDLLKETSQIIGLIEVVYGSNHIKLAWAHINLAHVYLECKSMPIQAKAHSEDAFRIQVEYLKKLALEEQFSPEDGLGEYELIDQKYQMILNYVYGKASSLLNEHKEAQKALEKSEEYLQNWIIDNKKMDICKKLKPSFYNWKKKIYFTLAKECTINKHYEKANKYYDKLQDLIDRKKSNGKSEKIGSDSANILLIEIFEEKAKLEKKRDNHREAIGFQKDAIHIAESCGSDNVLLESKFNLAKIYADMNDVTGSDNAEDIFKECVDFQEKTFNGEVTEKILQIKEEFVKFYLKQEKYDDCCKLMNSLIKDRISFSGPYSVKLSTNYKVLCSLYLKKNDMPNAAKFLLKSLQFEELNYGTKDKRTLATKATLEELKKNPSVSEKLKSLMKRTNEKPSFNAGKKINYFKDDLKIYSQIGTENAKVSVKSENSRANTTRADEDIDDILENLNPLK